MRWQVSTQSVGEGSNSALDSDPEPRDAFSDAQHRDELIDRALQMFATASRSTQSQFQLDFDSNQHCLRWRSPEESQHLQSMGHGRQ